MSTHKSGLGLKVDPAFEFELQSDLSDGLSDAQAGLSWDADASDRAAHTFASLTEWGCGGGTAAALSAV